MSLVTVVVVFMGSLLWLHRFLRAAVSEAMDCRQVLRAFRATLPRSRFQVLQLVYPGRRTVRSHSSMVTTRFSSLSFTQTVVSTNYERVLHSAAGLTTTPGVFASGCASPNTGISTRPIVYAGQTTSGIKIFATVSYNPMTGNNALYTMNLNTSSISVHDLPTAGALTTVDLNGDGNGDLVIVNSDLTTDRFR